MKYDVSTEIATMEERLAEKVLELFGAGASVDQEKTGSNYILADDDVCGILVNERGDAGAVKTIGSSANESIETSPSNKSQYWILKVEAGETGLILGKAKYRCIRYNK